MGDTGERAKDDSRNKGKGQEESALNRTRGTTVCGQRHPGVQRHGPQESCRGWSLNSGSRNNSFFLSNVPGKPCTKSLKVAWSSLQ